MTRTLILAAALLSSTARADSIEPLTEEKPLHNQLRGDFAFSGPGGMIALRYSRVLDSGLRIEPAIGIGQSGYFGSAIVTMPFYVKNKVTKSGLPYRAQLEVYAGYGASYYSADHEHPWSGNPNFFPVGVYHWVDFGISQTTTVKGWIVGMGGGASILVHSPMSATDEMHEDEDLWWVFPEGWMRKQHWVPTLWTTIGREF